MAPPRRIHPVKTVPSKNNKTNFINIINDKVSSMIIQFVEVHTDQCEGTVVQNNVSIIYVTAYQ